MEIFIFGVIFFIIALIIRRKEAFKIWWKPTKHTWIAIGTGLLVFILSLLTLFFYETAPLISYIIVYIFIFTICGFAIPWIYTLLVEKTTLSSMGLTKKQLILSLILSIIFAGLFFPELLIEGNLGSIGFLNLAKASFVLTGVGGIFELFLYYGFIHLKLRKAFGIIPAILITSFLYVLWHVGTQLSHEPDTLYALWKLFWVGIMYQSVFSITRNLLIIWPVFHGVGVMFDFAVNLGDVKDIVADFSWAVSTMISMVLVGIVLYFIRKRKYHMVNQN
jgi:membrane protease YdiL (CAAX protease family)